MTAAVALLANAAPLASRPAQWRVGLIVLATDHTSERDFVAMRPSDELAVYVNRVNFANPANRENLMAMRPLLTAAATLILPGESLDAVAYSCTAASALLGDATIREAIRAAKPEVPVITPTSAAFQAFSTLGVGRISLLTPYSQTVTQALVEYLEAGGLEVLNASCCGIVDDRAIARIRPDFIRAAAREARHPQAEALFISCTALRATSVVQAIEDSLDIPVVTSNQAMVWQTLRLVGCDLPVSGFGRLLSAH